MEHGCMIVLRLRKLVESKCDKLALNFSHKAIEAFRRSSDIQPLHLTVCQTQDLQETYLSLLFKFKKLEMLKKELESMDDDSAYDFLRSSLDREAVDKATMEKTEQINPVLATTVDKKSGFNRLLKYRTRVNQYALQLYVIRLLSNDSFSEEANADRLKHYLKRWIEHYKDEKNFKDLFRKLVNNSHCRLQQYVACGVLFDMVRRCFQLSACFYLSGVATNRICSFFLVSRRAGAGLANILLGPYQGDQRFRDEKIRRCCRC